MRRKMVAYLLKKQTFFIDVMVKSAAFFAAQYALCDWTIKFKTILNPSLKL